MLRSGKVPPGLSLLYFAKRSNTEQIVEADHEVGASRLYLEIPLDCG
jgi:hypothetical protein